MSYNLTLGNGTGMLSLVQMVNTRLMYGWLGALFLIVVSIILFTSFMLKTNDVGKSMATTAFISFTLALSLRGLDLLPNLGVFITLIAAGIAVATTWNK